MRTLISFFAPLEKKTVRHNKQQLSAQLTTHYSLLTTHNSQLTTHLPSSSAIPSPPPPNPTHSPPLPVPLSLPNDSSSNYLMRVTSSSRDSPNSSSRRLHPTSTASVSPAYLAHLSSSTTFQSFLRSIGPPHPSATSTPSADAAFNSPALPPANSTALYLPPRDMPDVLLQARAHQRRLLRDFPSRRHSNNPGNELRRAALQGITTPPIALSDGSEAARERETGDERPNSKRIKRECNEDEPLQFEVLYEDGGHYR